MKLWRKSSRSENDQNCVEVRCTLHAVRDSKNASSVLRGDVRRLVQAVKGGQL